VCRGEPTEGIFHDSILTGMKGNDGKPSGRLKEFGRLRERLGQGPEFVVDRHPDRLEGPRRNVETPGPSVARDGLFNQLHELAGGGQGSILLRGEKGPGDSPGRRFLTVLLENSLQL